MTTADWILTLTCADRVGIVAGVSGFLAERDGFILDSQQYADLDTGRFFMRVLFKAGGARFPADTDALRDAFARVAERLALDWWLHPSSARPRILIAVSKGSHCLNDLLHRWESGTLSAEIAGVVSNHEDLRSLVQWHGLPWHHLPVEAENRAEQERAIETLMVEAGADYLVLARYMQILTADFTARLRNRCVNIHHSFLPGFKGARPYHRAHARGVKLIGATAHFVTADLDEGPIIEQAVERVDHRASVDDMICIGRDIEAQVLARAINAIGERRVFLNGGKTVVFPMSLETLSTSKCFGGVQGVYRHASAATDTDMTFAVYVPEHDEGETLPVVWWLSGLTCTHANVVEKGEYRRACAEHRLIFVAPDTSPRGEGVPDDPDGAYDFGLGAGFYVDATQAPWSAHYRMWSYVSEELQNIVSEQFPIDSDRQSIMGHSMGGHGALTFGLTFPNLYRAVSAFAPIVAPSHVPWGRKALGGYLGPDEAAWRKHDAVALIEDGARVPALLVDQGEADQFLDSELRPDLLRHACDAAGIDLTLNIRPGYDHSYYFVTTFMADHLAWHAARLR